MEKSLTILLLEDVWTVAENIAKLLRAMGHKVVGPCATASAAFDAIDHRKVDFALLDLELHEGKCYLVADRMLDLGIPFIFLGHYANSDLPMRHHGQPFINKPVIEQTLVDAIDRMCNFI